MIILAHCAAGFTIGDIPASGWRQQPERYLGSGAGFVNGASHARQGDTAVSK